MGPFTLLCNYCPWSSAKHGIQFEKPTSISTQLSKMRTAATELNTHFSKARTYYTQKGKQQDELSNAPSSLSRMMAMYSAIGGLSGSKSKASFGKGKSEENSEIDGVMEVNESDELEMINRMRNANFEDC